LLKKALDGVAYNDERLREARQRLRQLAAQFPGNQIIAPINDSLREQAKALYEEARRLGKDKKTLQQAQDYLKQAEETWPELPGLRAYRIELSQSHPVLRVGVRELPRYLSPERACTDVELRAMELLFEGVVKLSPDESGALRYRAGLAEGRPGIVPLGRRFTLPRNARWSNDKELNAADVRTALRHWLEKPAGSWSAGPDVLSAGEVGNDPYRVTLTLRQGYIDPLSLMTFKIVPEVPKGEAEHFALEPVGSGPFVYKKGRSDDEGREFAAFVANPYYGTRAGKLGLPRIQEIRFYRSADPAKDFDQGKIDLALDLTAEQAAALKKRTDTTVPLRTGVPNRRVYFLALNLRRPALANADLRKALSLAIHREKLLDEHFRGALGKEVHKTLNGPYPAGSWACSPRVKGRGDGADPYDPDLAKALLNNHPEARKGLGPVPLKLKYPEGDPALAKALGALRDQVRTHTGVEIQLEPRDPRELKADVELTQSFDLAYVHYDFPDETYSLAPLLGPGNVFDFKDPEVETILPEMKGHREFAKVQRGAQQLHDVVAREVPLVPLWQLDPLLAWHKTVRPVPLDPLLVFTDIDQWKLEPRP
jgi:peptide/nickel transport system substrate-binding protein